MVVIRLARHGKKGSPIFKVTVADQKFALTGRFLEKIGIYNPDAKAQSLQLDMDRYNAWIAKGAQATDRVKKLIALQGLATPVAAKAAPAAAPAKAAKK